MLVRSERPTDIEVIRQIHRSAFPTGAEADLVDRLRHNHQARVSLVADANGEVLGHAVFSPVTLIGARREARGVALGPIAVRPDRQRQGIGSRLIETGIAQCRRAGFDFMVVLGLPEYFRRFGFRPASRFGLTAEFQPPDNFLALELSFQSLSGVGGRVVYAREFDALKRHDRGGGEP